MGKKVADQTYSDGVPKFITKEDAFTPTTEGIVINAVIGCNVKTNVINESFKVIDNIDNTVILGHFLLENIVEWHIVGNNILIITKNEEPDVITFESGTEALIGDFRIYKMLEGLSIISCGDEGPVPGVDS